MELAGHECVGFCEFDKWAVASYTSMHLITEEHYDYESKSRPEWCPLKPLPEKSAIENDMTDYQCGMVDGRNQCIDEIAGGE